MSCTVVQDRKTLHRVATEVLEDFARDNCRYLELRTTPRSMPDGTTKREYVETILDVFRAFKAGPLKDRMDPRLILSVREGIGNRYRSLSLPSACACLPACLVGLSLVSGGSEWECGGCVGHPNPHRFDHARR